MASDPGRIDDRGLHEDEKNDQVTFTSTMWEVKQAELIGTKEWHPSGSGLKEEGSFELHHTPQ